METHWQPEEDLLAYVHARRQESVDEQQRDMQCEERLIAWLRELPEEERWQQIQRVRQIEPGYGLVFAAECLQRSEYFEIILLEEMQRADRSSIGYWLDWLMPPLTPQQVFALLTNALDTMPQRVSWAIYKLGFVLQKQKADRKTVREFWRLVKLADRRGALEFDPGQWGGPNKRHRQQT